MGNLPFQNFTNIIFTSFSYYYFFFLQPSVVMLEFLAKLLKLQLMERVYDALAAQMELSIYQYDRGLVIKVSGLNHKLHVIYFNMLETYGSTCITYLI